MSIKALFIITTFIIPFSIITTFVIYNREPEAIACAKYSFWYDNLNRSVKARERGIPIIDSYKRIDYIFDISQTESRNMNVNNEVTLWQFNVDKDDSALKEIITKKGYNISEDPIENIQTLTSIHGAKEVFELMSELGIGYEKSVEFTDFLFNSVTYSVAQRFNISYNIDKEMIESSLKKLDSISLVGLGNAISNISKNVIEETISKTKKIEKDMELENKKNREEGVKDDNRLSTTILRGEELQGDSSRSTEDSSSGELSGYIRGNEYHRGNSSSSDGENKRRTVRLFPDEVRLYDDERERGTPEDGSGTIQGEQIDSTSFRSGRDGREDLGHGKTENDRVLGADRGTQETKSTEVQRADEQFKFIIERDSDKGSSGELKNNHEAKREVEETSLLFSTENNKNVVNAVKVGAVFILVSPEEVNHISLKSTKIVIDIEGKEYELYSGKTFEESQKVDRLIYDNSIKTYNISEYENKNTESIQNDIIEDSDAREIDEPIKNLNNSILQVGMEIKYEDEIYKIESINKEKPPFSIKLKGEDILENLITSSTVLFFENEKELLDKFDIIHSEIEESKNFSFDGEMLSGTLAPSERLNNNIKAIETLLKIETKDRNATIEDRKSVV